MWTHNTYGAVSLQIGRQLRKTYPAQQVECFPLRLPQPQQASGLRGTPSVDRQSAANSDHQQGRHT